MGSSSFNGSAGVWRKSVAEKGSPLAVGVNLLYEVEKVREVSPGSFSPPLRFVL